MCKIVNITELVSNLKFTYPFLIQPAKLDSRKIFLSLNLINTFTGNVEKYQLQRGKRAAVLLRDQFK